MEPYNFSPEQAFNTIKAHWTKWAESVGAKGFVVGISGGKDSSVVAALGERIFGKDKILGVLMPNGKQKDIADSKEVCDHLGIKSVTVNIGHACAELMDEIVHEALQICGVETASDDTHTNMPARLRMTTLYAVAQSLDKYFVLNTCNLSEDTTGFSSLYGDNAGSYAPIQRLTVTEVIALGDWLGLPRYLTHKTPVDGLQPKTDEEKLGFTYADLDRYIREDVGTPELKAKVDALYRRNKFKMDMIHIDGPNFDALGNFVRYNNLPDAEKGDKSSYADKLDIVRIDAEPRYPEDAEVNGVEEDNDNPKMPFLVKDEEAQDGWIWKLDIDIKTGEVIGWPKEVRADVHYKVCDCCRVKYAGNEYYEYVPNFLAINDNGYGDYIILSIEDGKIVNWSESNCRKWLQENMR